MVAYGGNKVLKKFISSGKIFGRTLAMSQLKRASLTKEIEFFYLKLISCDKKRFLVTRITIIFTIFILKRYIFFWLKIIVSVRKQFIVA